VANLSVLGYDPAAVLQGRAVLEAASMGVDLAPDDVALRCNLIALDRGLIADHSAGHIDSEDGAELIRAVAAAVALAKPEVPVSFHPGVGYRHLLVLHGPAASPAVVTAPPHDHVGEPAAALLPCAAGPEGKATARCLRDLHGLAAPVLAAHPVNRRRREQGQRAADSIWTWSPGRRPSMPTLEERFGLRGAVISAVDLVMGLGRYAGLDLIRVPGATGLWDTNYEGKADAALAALERLDFVYLHVEATDEAGHARDLDLKIRCIEQLDARIVGPILRGLEQRGLEAAVAVLPDHPTPVETGIHAGDPVPVAIRRPGEAPDAVQGYDELQAAAGSLGLLWGDGLMRLLVAGHRIRAS
jgi:2,3-bisphosphoglycerate-independent phosphoglycerate mutase